MHDQEPLNGGRLPGARCHSADGSPEPPAGSLRRRGLVSPADYGILITLVTEPTLSLRMSDLGTRRMPALSGITRVVSRLEEKSLVQRDPDPADDRVALAALTKRGLGELQRPEVVHHATVRELDVRRLAPRELKQLARLFEKALPGAVTASTWPTTEDTNT